jgi:hypothetical protein
VKAAWRGRFYAPVIIFKFTKWISNKFGIKESVLNIVGEFNHDYKPDIHLNNIKKYNFSLHRKYTAYALQKQIC